MTAKPMSVMTATASMVGVLLLMPVPSILAQSPPPAPVIQAPIYAGAPAATVGGIVPDASTVVLFVEGQPAGFTVPGGADTVEVTTSLLFKGVVLLAAQETPLGGWSPLSDPVVVAAQAPFAPVVQGPISEGAPSATVTGVVPDATLVILFVEGAPAGAASPDGSDTVVVESSFLFGGVRVTATQETPEGGTSAPSAPVVVQSINPPPSPPVVQGPIFAGDPSVTVTGVVPDATMVAVLVEGLPAGGVAPGGADTVVVPTPFLFKGVTVLAAQEAPTGGWSLLSNPVVVEPLAPPPAPVVQAPIFAGDPSATVTGVVPDATLVVLLVEGQPAGAATPEGSDTVVIDSPYLLKGASVTAVQETPEGGMSAPSGPVVVQPPLAPPVPVVQGPIQDGDPSATVTGIVPDATMVNLYVEGYPAGSVAPGGADTVEIATNSLVGGLAVTATQVWPTGGTSAPSEPVVVLPSPITPTEGATLNRTHVAFAWPPVDGATRYQLWIVEDDGSPDPFAGGPLIDLPVVPPNVVITHGLAFGRDYAWQVRGVAGNPPEWSPLHRFSTAELPEFMPQIRVTRTAGRMEPGVTLFSVVPFGAAPRPFSEGLALAIDELGNVVWFLTWPDMILDLRLLGSGRILFETRDATTFNPKRGYEATLGGVATWASPEAPEELATVHHEVFPMPNGNFMALTEAVQEVIRDDEPQEWIGDRIVEFDRETNEVVWEWNSFDHFSTEDFDPTEMEAPNANGQYDWTHANAVVYNEADNSVYLSVRHMSRITRIDYGTGEIVYNMGMDMPSGDADFGNNLFSFQHAPERLPNGNMMVYDNGNRRDGIDHDGATGVTKTIELAFTGGDPPTGASIVWEWDHPEYSSFVGDADRLPGGNTLTTASFGIIYELDPAANLIWKMELTGGSAFNSYLTYRAEREPTLYPAPPAAP